MKKHTNVSQGTEEWHHLRKGKVTGTTLKSIMGTPKARQEAIYEILAERLTVGTDSEYENAMDRGTRLEPEAIAEFELQTGKQVYSIGMCSDEDEPNIAQSPDGYILNTDDTEAVEIKCMGGKNHVKMWLTNKVPDEYEWQVVQYFITNQKLKTVWFVGYNPDIPAKTLHIIQVTRESVEKEILKGKEEQKKFLQEVDELLKGIIKL